MINNSTSATVESIADRSRPIAEAAAIERLLNVYLRETGIFHPALETDHPARTLIPPSVLNEIQEQGDPMRLELEMTGVVIYGAVLYMSPFGHHRYGTSFWLETTGVDANRTRDCRRLKNCKELAELMLNEIAVKYSSADARIGRVQSMLAQIENSVEKTEKYVKHHFARESSLWNLTGAERVYTAEQSLLYGHPFHPTPKSSEGFLPDDLTRYAPEMGAAFALHYFAVAPELAEEAFLQKTDAELFPPQVLETARQRLTSDLQHYRLLPCHPWQAEYLKEWPEVQHLLDSAQLVELGELGNRVYSTSSVRTVWDPNHAFIFKLPLNVRITNFVRVNPLEQLQRSIDASRVLEFLKGKIPYEDFYVLMEAGYRTVSPAAVPVDRRQKLVESFAVIFRENPIFCPVDSAKFAGEDTPTVVAALLEQPPHAKEPPLWEAVRLAAKVENVVPDCSFVNKWLKRYLEISLLPIVWLFLEHGVSMEAHVQNSMVTLQNGWPVRFYVRDLEGVSISREQAVQQNLFEKRVNIDSPALYEDHEAWHRLKYYVFVNHLGHLLHTLAYYGKSDELALWQMAGEVLETSGLFEPPERKQYIRDLFENQGFPAKANFVSCFQKRGETPLYVNIPNPLTKCEVKV